MDILKAALDFQEEHGPLNPEVLMHRFKITSEEALETIQQVEKKLIENHLKDIGVKPRLNKVEVHITADYD